MAYEIFYKDEEFEIKIDWEKVKVKIKCPSCNHIWRFPMSKIKYDIIAKCPECSHEFTFDKSWVSSLLAQMRKDKKPDSNTKNESENET